MATITRDLDTTNLVGMTTETTSIAINISKYQVTQIDVTVSVNEGFSVETEPVLTLTFGYDTTPTTRTRTVSGVLQQDGTYLCSLRFVGSSSITDFISCEISGLAIRSAILEKYNFINVYKADNTIINQIANIRFYYSGSETERIDLGKYIYSFVHYPLVLSESEETTNIKLGFYQTEITTKSITEQYIETVLFDKIISGFYGNESDINNARIVLKLPFYGLFELSSNYINKTIKVVYNTDILTNTTIISIYADNILVNELDCSIGYEEPYLVKENVLDQTYNSRISTTANKTYRGAVYVYQKKNSISDRIDLRAKQTINDLSGYVRGDINSFIPNQIITPRETEMIKTLFNNGVIV